MAQCSQRISAARCLPSVALYCNGWRTACSRTSEECKNCSGRKRSSWRNWLPLSDGIPDLGSEAVVAFPKSSLVLPGGSPPSPIFAVYSPLEDGKDAGQKHSGIGLCWTGSQTLEKRTSDSSLGVGISILFTQPWLLRGQWGHSGATFPALMCLQCNSCLSVKQPFWWGHRSVFSCLFYLFCPYERCFKNPAGDAHRARIIVPACLTC